MASEQKERLELVTKRLKEELTLQNDFFQACCELALGTEKSLASHEYLSYRVCREQLGHKDGVYLCLLYAQLFSSDCLLKEYGSQLEESLRDEFVCVNRELLSQILLMEAQHDGPDQIRDALYWFYSDYCELFVQLHAILLQKNAKLVFGGPFLISPLQCSNDTQWEQHIWDCGLYLGKRFEERFFQAVRKTFFSKTIPSATVSSAVSNKLSDSNDCLHRYTELFPKQVSIKEPVNEVFLLTSWQREQWKQMNTQLRLMAK